MRIIHFSDTADQCNEQEMTMWDNTDKEDSAGFADEPHGTLIYLIVLAACFGAVAVVLGFLP